MLETGTSGKHEYVWHNIIPLRPTEPTGWNVLAYHQLRRNLVFGFWHWGIVAIQRITFGTRDCRDLLSTYKRHCNQQSGFKHGNGDGYASVSWWIRSRWNLYLGIASAYGTLLEKLLCPFSSPSFQRREVPCKKYSRPKICLIGSLWVVSFDF